MLLNGKVTFPGGSFEGIEGESKRLKKASKLVYGNSIIPMENWLRYLIGIIMQKMVRPPYFTRVERRQERVTSKMENKTD